MAQARKFIRAIVIAIVAVIGIGLLLMLLSITGVEMTPVIMTISYVFTGICIGIGFYIAKQLLK